MTEPVELVQAIDARAGELEGVARVETPRGDEYRRNGIPFAVREGTAIAFRLRPEIVAAALRTPDTSVAARGADWVRLDPVAVDEFALDRALAWLESAWRLAGEDTAERRGRVN